VILTNTNHLPEIPSLASPLRRKGLSTTLDTCMNLVARRSVAECSSTLISRPELRPMVTFMPGGAAMQHLQLVGDPPAPPPPTATPTPPRRDTKQPLYDLAVKRERLDRK
jgi:hypothetical protein